MPTFACNLLFLRLSGIVTSIAMPSVPLAALVVALTLSLPGATSAQAVVTLDQTMAIGNHIAEGGQDIPSNIVAAPILRWAIETMWHGSPTFKAQCARLRGAPTFLVEFRFGNPSQLGAARARTNFARSPLDTMRADIYIDPDLRSLAYLVELIAHELEHVIEQLDEVELTPAERHGVFRTGDGGLETARAIHIGQKVSGEVYDATNSGSRARPL